MSRESIRVFAPATVANVSCGFDILGFAVDNPGDEVVLTRKKSQGIKITGIEGDEGKLTTDPDKNTATVSIRKYLDHIGCGDGFEVSIKKKMPLGSGLGSSAASSVAGVFAVNELLGRPLEQHELLPFAMEGERIACGSPHADNVAPSLMGGFILIRSYSPLDFKKIPTPPALYSSIVHPHIEVQTKDARSILKKQILLKDAVVQWGNVGGLIAGLLLQDYGLIGRSMEDVIVEPIRSILIPGFQDVKDAAISAGALGAGISGSGPSIFALSEGGETAEKVGEAMQKVFADININSEAYVSQINNNGPLILD